MNKVMIFFIVNALLIQVPFLDGMNTPTKDADGKGKAVCPNTDDRHGITQALVFTAHATRNVVVSDDPTLIALAVLDRYCDAHSPARRGLQGLSSMAPASTERIKKRVRKSMGGDLPEEVGVIIDTASSKKKQKPKNDAIEGDGGALDEYDFLIDNLAQGKSNASFREEAFVDAGELFSTSNSSRELPIASPHRMLTAVAQHLPANPISDLQTFAIEYPCVAASLVYELMSESSINKHCIASCIEDFAQLLTTYDGNESSQISFNALLNTLNEQSENSFLSIILGLGFVRAIKEGGVTVQLDESTYGQTRRIYNILLENYITHWNQLAFHYWDKRTRQCPADQQIIYRLMYYDDFSSRANEKIIQFRHGGISFAIKGSLILAILRDGLFLGNCQDKEVSGNSRDLCSPLDIAAGIIAGRDPHLVEGYYTSALKNSWIMDLSEKDRSFSFDRKSPNASIALNIFLNILEEQGFKFFSLSSLSSDDLTQVKSLQIKAQRNPEFSRSEPYCFIRFNRERKPGASHPNLGQIIVNIEYINGFYRKNGHLGIVDPSDIDAVFDEIIRTIPVEAKKGLSQSSSASLATNGAISSCIDDEDGTGGLFDGGDGEI
ncbi:hypothetical protein FJ364_03320 [Candidatus Dependentiae bacterium]|nr:hypothetical protein [Candidatus Dependentiae bacterium]